jgi:hypothetical protein
LYLTGFPWCRWGLPSRLPGITPPGPASGSGQASFILTLFTI